MDGGGTVPVLKPKSQKYRLSATFFLALLAALILLPCIAVADSFDVKNIRVAKNGQVTRVVFDTNATPSYKMFTLNNPSRLVIDLSNAKLSTQVNQSVFDSSFVKQLRHAQRSNNKLRIVLDLNQKIVPKSFVLPPNNNAHHRLVIDLKNPTTSNSQLAKKNNNATANKTKTVKQNSPAKKKVASKPLPKKAKVANKEQDIIAKVTTPLKAQNKPKPAPTLKSAKTKPSNKTIVIAIDPGHGGKDPGATGYAGTREKDVVLKISKRLARLINAEKACVPS